MISMISNLSSRINIAGILPKYKRGQDSDFSFVPKNLKYGYNYQHDILDIKNNISFKSTATQPNPTKLIIAQMRIARKKIQMEEQGLIFTLADLDSNDLDGILDGIKVFKGLSPGNYLALGHGQTAIHFHKGCNNNCAHCMEESGPLKFRSGKIKSMKWGNFTDLADGIAEVNKRMGFNLFGLQRSGGSYLRPFNNSDPINVRCYGNNGQSHNIAEVVKYFYDKVKVPALVTTAGWDEKEAHEQKAAEDLAKIISDDPTCVVELNISVNTFHKYMDESIKLSKTGNPADMKKSKKLRQKYIKRMTNVIKTFLPAFEKGKADILVRYAPDNEMNSGYRLKESEQLVTDILENLRTIYGIDLSQYRFKSALVPGSADLIKYDRILPEGRGRRFFSAEDLGKSSYTGDHIESFIDPDGRLMVHRAGITKPTGIQLNFTH